MSRQSSGDQIVGMSMISRSVPRRGQTHETTNLEQRLRITYNIKEPTPPRHLRLTRTTYNHIQRGIEMIQKLDYSRENPVCGIHLDIFQVRLCLHNGVQKDFERVSEEGQFLVVRSEGDGVIGAASFEIMQEDVVQEKVGLHCVQQDKRRHCQMYKHLWTGGTSRRIGSSSRPLRALSQ